MGLQLARFRRRDRNHRTMLGLNEVVAFIGERASLKRPISLNVLKSVVSEKPIALTGLAPNTSYIST